MYPVTANYSYQTVKNLLSELMKILIKIGSIFGGARGPGNLACKSGKLFLLL